jgi:hypothetical protein
MPNECNAVGFHEATASASAVSWNPGGLEFTYRFENFFHPFVGELLRQLNEQSLPKMLDPAFLDGLADRHGVPPASNSLFHWFKDFYNRPAKASSLVKAEGSPKDIDLSVSGPYANYNWELLFHIPLAVAVHLSKSQRFAEAQRWFHLIFDPTCNDETVPTPARFWKFLGFRTPPKGQRIEDIIRLLSTRRCNLSDSEKAAYDDALNSYTKILEKPFQPHRVACIRTLAYQYSVVMKYLDNLIAWGDQLFLQDTVEAINEATQRYVLAANLLGARPQRIPPRGAVPTKTFRDLKQGLGAIGNALVDLEGLFPLNLAPLPRKDGGTLGGPLFGIGRTLYFCIPRNEKLLGYWDTVADRLFKIRHCMNMQGLVRPLALFDPPLDPAMLIKAAAAGIDIGSIVSGLNQPASPVRSLFLIQKALELTGEVRGLGGALLAALEKGDAEQLALLRQNHELKLQELSVNVRHLQWRSAQEATKSLLTTRATALERFQYYQRMLSLPANPAVDVPDLEQSTDPNMPPTLTAANFESVYGALVTKYDKSLQLATWTGGGEGASPAEESGQSGQGKLYLNSNEDAELNTHLPTARDAALTASAANSLASGFAPVPDSDVDLHYWGIGGKVKLNIGKALVAAAKITGDISNITAGHQREQAGIAAKTASYERRAGDWILQYNLAAHELMQNGRQILAALIAEQLAKHEYDNLKGQNDQSKEVLKFLQGEPQTSTTMGAVPGKFSTQELYAWMQGELFRLYYEYYRFAFVTARQAEKTMKQELMRPEVDGQTFIKFNYWDGGRKGLLSGEALHLDLKRMELAYHENNRRELELTRHVSLRQLDPLALLRLKTAGSCTVTIPEWLYDLDCPGHYLRRIKSVALSIPSVVGPYTSLNCTLSLLRSSLRKVPDVGEDGYARLPPDQEDARFIDYVGGVQSVVTSAGSNDSGLFETNLRDERFLPFEGAGAISTWKLDLPADYRAFDYATIPDVILHVRYTARQGVPIPQVKATLDTLLALEGEGKLGLLFSLRYDFPTEWAAFLAGTGDLVVTIRKDYFPYFAQRFSIKIANITLYDGQDAARHESLNIPTNADDNLNDPAQQGQVGLTAPASRLLTRSADTEIFLVIGYAIEKG